MLAREFLPNTKVDKNSKIEMNYNGYRMEMRRKDLGNKDNDDYWTMDLYYKSELLTGSIGCVTAKRTLADFKKKVREEVLTLTAISNMLDLIDEEKLYTIIESEDDEEF